MNDEAPMEQDDAKRRYDLEERTAKFGEAIIAYARKLPIDAVVAPLISQIVRSGTSVGANYCEADDAGSKKESRETKHWLRMIATAAPEKKAEARTLWHEASELHLIFAKIWRSCGS